MSAIQVAIRIKPQATSATLSGQSSTAAAPTETTNLVEPAVIVPWRVESNDTLCYDGQPLPEGIRPSGPLSFTFGIIRLLFYGLLILQ